MSNQRLHVLMLHRRTVIGVHVVDALMHNRLPRSMFKLSEFREVIFKYGQNKWNTKLNVFIKHVLEVSLSGNDALFRYIFFNIYPIVHKQQSIESNFFVIKVTSYNNAMYSLLFCSTVVTHHHSCQDNFCRFGESKYFIIIYLQLLYLQTFFIPSINIFENNDELFIQVYIGSKIHCTM